MWRASLSALALLGAGGGAAGARPHTGAPDGAPSFPASAFVHLFEWSWEDVARECEEFLGPKGFTAVQISPPNDHMKGPEWWVRYQPVTYNLTSRSGDEAAFVDMVQRCAKAGVGIYVDAVINHVARGPAGQVSVAGNTYGARATPIYGPEDMHHLGNDLQGNCQINNYADKYNVQYCDLENLPDLCTACGQVQDRIAAYLNRVLELGAAGLRIDAAKHQDAGELGALLAKVRKGTYLFQEVIASPGEAVQPEGYYPLGQVTEFNYPKQLAPNFLEEGKLQYFGSFGEGWGLAPAATAVVFLDNHDTQRGDARLTHREGKLYELANVFMLAHPYGYPKVMSSYPFSGHDQGPPEVPVHRDGGGVNCNAPPTGRGLRIDGPWLCEHRWPAVANMAAWRRAAGTAGVEQFQAPGGDTIAFCRGGAACVALNRQEQATWTVTVKFSVPAGSYCNVIASADVHSCPVVEVARDGAASLQVPPLSAVAVHVGKRAAPRSEPRPAGRLFTAAGEAAWALRDAAGSMGHGVQLALGNFTSRARQALDEAQAEARTMTQLIV